MNRSLKTTLFLALAPLLAQGKGNAKNVLFIFIDDLRPSLGCYGDELAITPNIDSFAQQGFLFQRAYCQQAVSGPSRASLLTGSCPDAIGVTDLNTHFRKKCPDAITLPQFFKNKKYQSIGIGKVFHGTENMQDSLSWSKKPTYNLSIKKEEYVLPQNRHGKKATAVEISNKDEKDFLDGKVTQEALTQLEQLKKNREPFFLAVGFIKPHLPFSVPKKYYDLYENKLFQPSGQANYYPKGSPLIAGHHWEELRGYTDIPDSGPLPAAKQTELIKSYYACISFVDKQVGLLFKKLKELQLEDNTIIVIWGDNGFHLGEQNLWGKSTNFELDCRIPLIIYDPQYKEKSKKIDRIVESVDVYPTLLDLCGWEPENHLPGKSLRILMDNEKANWKDRAFSQFPRPYKAINSAQLQTHMGYTIRVDKWRYTLWYDIFTNSPSNKELYSIHSDLYELENLSGQSKYADIESELSKMIENYKQNK